MCFSSFSSVKIAAGFVHQKNGLEKTLVTSSKSVCTRFQLLFYRILMVLFPSSQCWFWLKKSRFTLCTWDQELSKSSSKWSQMPYEVEFRTLCNCIFWYHSRALKSRNKLNELRAYIWLTAAIYLVNCLVKSQILG